MQDGSFSPFHFPFCLSLTILIIGNGTPLLSKSVISSATVSEIWIIACIHTHPCFWCFHCSPLVWGLVIINTVYFCLSSIAALHRFKAVSSWASYVDAARVMRRFSLTAQPHVYTARKNAVHAVSDNDILPNALAESSR
ncbi:uncharacterized protein BJ212DRAFT_1335573 [Suillus subaureus]|uniref:Uncharacterized protein n=1 Tax=Suillus subaureus TaxID=48587 RepID=A0A9P7JG66_9AGAM|nr:uncharacterized protein BJ212DRAFT_1335573 [Suillus subaureus]KAG1820811.1 hypothetical protein BJ212DRAFT_1335573 [Suillus subaureus]